jgi:hypothetical protein
MKNKRKSPTKTKRKPKKEDTMSRYETQNGITSPPSGDPNPWPDPPPPPKES